MYVTERWREKEREIDRKKDSMERVRETGWQLSPRGVRSLLWASFWFFSFSPNPLPPSLFFSVTSYVPSVGVSSGHLPTCLPPPSLFVSPSDTLLCTFTRVPWGTWPLFFPSALLGSVSPPPPLTLTYLRSSLPGRFAHQLFVIQFTLLQQIQDILLLHADTNRKHKVNEKAPKDLCWVRSIQYK